MKTAVFRIAVFATAVTMSTSSTITPTTDMVTVRLGEAIRLSCVITLTPTESVSQVRWYRNSSFIPYGSIDATSRCPTTLLCPGGSTTDNRGTVRYEIRSMRNEAVLTLTINRSTLQDNGSFMCGIIKDGGSSQTSSGISVTIYVLEATSPNPGHHTPLGSITTESTTNSPDTTTVDRSILSQQTSTTPTTSLGTTTKAISSTVTETSTDTTDSVATSHQQDIPTIPRKSSSTTDETLEAPVSLTVPILAVAVSACVVTIIILLIIIAHLVSSRKRRSQDAEPRLGLRSPEGVASSLTPQDNGPMYQNTNKPHAYENSFTPNMQQQVVDKSTSEQPSTVAALPTDYEPVQAGGGIQPERRGQDTSTVTTGHAESGYQALEMTNQPPAEYTKLDLAIRDG